MGIDIKDIITLSDDRSYVVVSKTTYQDNTYYYIIDKHDTTKIKFCLENSKNGSLIEIDDKNLIKKLLPLFLESSSSAITKEDIEFLENYDK